ncbi:hypothetical protein BC827DRAFT_1185706 [Russula dissimulans]|nr:hypothetical protein BC827DRAFT_1185706 [Russula dissimulans]
MPKGPKRTFQKDISRINNRTSRQSAQSAQHGQYSSPLLLLPAESLTHITSFLDPVSLCSLAQTNRKLYEHVSDDNTWRRAFVCQFLGVSPENALNDARPLTFRLTQKTWRSEFVRRHIIRGLWSRSQYTVISHHPLPAPISVIHVMADYALLSASTQYATVARSFPFKDKVLKGYLYGTGVPPGLGNDLPNTNLIPNISACALASDGTTAKVLWGRQDGSVIAVSHPRTMSGTQAPAQILTSSVRQEHQGVVIDGTWAANGNAFVTAGSDGRVKVWTVTPFRCAWTSERHLLGQEVDAISKVAEDLESGLVVAATRSGDVIIWSGFDVSSLGSPDAPTHGVQKLRIPASAFPIPDINLNSVPQPMETSALFLQVSSPTRLSILACYRSMTRFYRCSVDLLSEQVDIKPFGNPSFGNIRCIQPAFSNDPAVPSFVLTGAQLGKICVYDWSTTSLSSDLLPATRHLGAFSDAHVTSLAMNPFVIVAGSSRGSIVVLDMLTLETLGSFTGTMNNDVQQIELAGDVLVASVGSKVLAWGAGHFSSGGKNPRKVKGKGKHGGHGKWFKQAELRNAIAETSYLGEVSSPSRRSLGPEREQLMQLHALGLSEREAVEYTLMLSRDEELCRLERVFETEESSGSQSGSDQSSLSSSSVRQYSSPLLRPSTSASSTSSHGQLVPLASPSRSNIKVQVSPRFYPEPMEAGGLPFYSLSTLGRTSPQAAPLKQGKQPNAWSKPLPGTSLSVSPPVPTRNYLPSPRQTNWEVESERRIRQVEDFELRFALELSLAEAQKL